MAQDERSYHHGALRQTLMEAALSHIAAGGTERLSLRALAREAGVSPTAPYRHFPSKKCLLAALITRGFRTLGEQMQAAAEAHDDPDERFVWLGMGYVRFALDNPTAFELMFSTALGDFSQYEELMRASTASYRVLLDALEALPLEERAPGFTVSEAGGVAWAAVHGIASVLLFGRGRGASSGLSSPMASLASLERDPEKALRLLLRGFRA